MRILALSKAVQVSAVANDQFFLVRYFVVVAGGARGPDLYRSALEPLGCGLILDLRSGISRDYKSIHRRIPTDPVALLAGSNGYCATGAKTLL
jgi:hypothetical protein